MKRFLALVLGIILLTGCNSNTDSTFSDLSLNTDSSSMPSLDSGAESSLVDDISSTNSAPTSGAFTQASESLSEDALTDCDSLVYSGNSRVLISDFCSFEIPVEVAEELISVDDAIKKAEEITEDPNITDIDREYWTKMFENSGYFLNYHEAAMLMSEELLIQVNLFEADSGTPSLINVLSDTDDVTTFNQIFGKLVMSSLYHTLGFSMLSRAGVVQDDDKHMLSFIFACDTKDFSLTDGYFGYFIVGYSAKANTLMTCLISGLSGISDPELIARVFDSFSDPDESLEYWAKLERSN